MSKKNGFTLVELLIVISILAILTVVGVVLYTNISKSSRDSKRKADIQAIARAYETNYQNGGYQTLTTANFASGTIPQDPAGGDYYNVYATDGSGFKVCASLEDHPGDFCNNSSPTCFCTSSSQGTIAQGSAITGTGSGIGLGGGSLSHPTSCDQNQTLDDGLTGYWKMDEVSSTIPDDSGTSNNATTQGSNYSVTGKFGNAFRVGPATTNIFDNPSIENVVGGYTPGWDTTLNGTEYPGYLSSGYNSGVTSPSVGYHAHISPSGNGYRGNRSLEYKDFNTSYGYPHRWLGIANTLGTYSALGGLGAQVTVSMMMKTDNASGKYVHFGLYGNTYGWVGATTSKYVSQNNTWQRVTHTFTLGGTSVPGTQSVALYIYGQYGVDANLWIDDVQTELGSVARPFTEGTMGTGYSWVGTDSRRTESVATTTSTVNNSSGTISFWVSADAVDEANQCPLGPNNGDSTGGIAIGVKRTGINMSHSYNAGQNVSADYQATITNNQWHHIVYTWNETTKKGYLYVDGQQRSSVDYLWPITTGASLNKFGTCVKSSYTDFAGKLDDVRIYNRALTGPEVTSLYSSGNGCLPS